MSINHLTTVACRITNKFFKIGGWALIFAAAASVQGALTNPGFTDGLNGWQQANTSYKFLLESDATQLATVVDKHQPKKGSTAALYTPPTGSQFLQLQAGSADQWVTVFQSVLLKDGESVKGFAAFSGFDYLNDMAQVRIISPSGIPEVIWERCINDKDVGDEGHTPLESWSYQAVGAGNYTVEYRVKNALETGISEGKYASYGLFTAVPEPSTWVGGIGAGVLTVLYGLRVRRSQTDS